MRLEKELLQVHAALLHVEDDAVDVAVDVAGVDAVDAAAVVLVAAAVDVTSDVA